MSWRRFGFNTAAVLALAIGLNSHAGCDTKEAAVRPAEPILATLKPTHPRILIDADTFARIKKLIATDPLPARWYAAVKADAVEMLTQPPSKYEIPDGRRLLSVSRRVLDRVRTLAFVYGMERDRRYADRAWAEVQAAASFKDWNPSHFLDTAEMTHAFALAYDWLYDVWSAEQRRVLREAIVTKGLKEALKVYESGGGWAAGWNNWNQVCNGGIGTGALAIADEEPELASTIIEAAIKSIPRPMEHYAPDGAGTEGVTYWDYGSRYNVLLIASLESALGSDLGLSQIDGFAQSGAYQLYMAGATRMSFNFADCGLQRMSAPQHFWMGRRFKRPEYSWYRYSELQAPEHNGRVLDLLWYDDSARDYDPSALPLDKHFRVAECVSMRSAWNDPNALVVGFQAGDNRNLGGHRHLDLGTFILEALGERWIIDPGTEGQTYMGHLHHNPKWKYYRVRAEGHNTLVMNPAEGPDQELQAKADIVQFDATPKGASAVADLTQAYAPHANRVQRTIAMPDRSYVIVTDVLDAKAPAELWWFAHTQAEATLSADRTTATLTQNGRRLSVQIIEPKGATFAVMPAAVLPTSPNIANQASNEGMRKLGIHLTGVSKLKLTVKFTPEG